MIYWLSTQNFSLTTVEYEQNLLPSHEVVQIDSIHQIALEELVNWTQEWMQIQQHWGIPDGLLRIFQLTEKQQEKFWL